MRAAFVKVPEQPKPAKKAEPLTRVSSQPGHKMPNKRGAKLKLTPEVVQRLHAVLANCNTVKTACQAVGIHPSTFYDWTEKGERAKEGIYSEFTDMMSQARAITKINLVGLINKAAVNDWRAASWLLEHSFPEEYGNREKREITGKDQGPVEVKCAAPFVVNLITYRDVARD